jgi:ligand-binding sensor domain-containing protein
VYLTTNEGYNWVKKTNGLTNKNTRALLATTGSVFAGIKNGGLFRSDNNGSNWVDVSNGLTNNDVTSLASAGSEVFTGTANGLFRSTDNGQHWTTVSNGLGSSKINALLTLNTSLFAGTDRGIYLSADFGDTWESINGGLPDTVITSLGMSRTDLFAGVLGQNVWTRPLSELLSLEITPQNLLLEQSASSSDTLFIIASTVWSIKGTLPSWLSMSKNTSSGNDQVIFTSLQDNASNTGRVALFTVETNTGLEKAFSVTQKSAIAGIEDLLAGSILIYPNPTYGMLNIVSKTPVSGITLSDPAGRILLEKQVNASNTSIDLSGLPKGLLFIKISVKNGDIYQKIMHD